MYIITIILFILIIQNFGQNHGNQSTMLNKDIGENETCTINRQICKYLMIDTENGINVINKNILNYFNQQFPERNQQFYSKYGFNSIGYNDVKKVITTSIVFNIQNKTIQKAADIFSDFKDNSILEELVKSTFLTVDIDLLLKFSEKIQQPIIYHHIFNEIIKHFRISNLLQFAEAVKNQLNICPSGKCLEILLGVKEKLPDTILKIIFSDTVCIKNSLYDEYLYAEDFLYKENRRFVFTKIIDKDKKPIKGVQWKLESIENGKYFYLKNIDYNEYLYVMDMDGYDSSRRYTVTWVPGTVDSAGKWKLELIDGNLINIRNVAFNNYYFYSAQFGYDTDKRFVFTWFEDNWDEQFPWKIVNC